MSTQLEGCVNLHLSIIAATAQSVEELIARYYDWCALKYNNHCASVNSRGRGANRHAPRNGGVAIDLFMGVYRTWLDRIVQGAKGYRESAATTTQSELWIFEAVGTKVFFVKYEQYLPACHIC